MRELIFFTSNATKLAHARYIAEAWQVKIKSFKQRTYHANYDEPRLSSREALLDASYHSAVGQCRKAGISTETTPFFLEDTSVRIDAFSSETVEIPGLDVKFWMKEQDFTSLDIALGERGNNRSVSVRSDVVLHVPSSLKAAWNVDGDYIVFVGTQNGTIVAAESEYQSNLVFPWLDNQSFNKWFQAEGTGSPFGALDIVCADSVDFRRKSIAQLFEFLEEKSYFGGQFDQLALQLYSKPNLIVCGYTCSGKTVASQHLAHKFGYLHIEASDFMHLSYLYRHGYRGRTPIGDFAEEALKQKPAIAAEMVVEYIEDNPLAPVVVSGFRSPEEIDFLREKLSPQGKDFIALFVDACEQERFRRLQHRMRPGDNISVSDFGRRDLQQLRMGLEGVRRTRSDKVLSNNGALDEYLVKIDEVVKSNDDADEFDIAAALNRAAADVTGIRIESGILIALLSVWLSDETRPFFTTTQIANLIRTVLPRIRQKKHKDNVSRYFNQDFYPYYEINNDLRSAVRKYRLSNTGYGQAVRVLNHVARQLSGAHGNLLRTTGGQIELVNNAEGHF